MYSSSSRRISRKFDGRFLGGLVVQAGPSQTQQLALPTHAQLGMILVDQATLVSYRDRQLFF